MSTRDNITAWIVCTYNERYPHRVGWAVPVIAVQEVDPYAIRTAASHMVESHQQAYEGEWRAYCDILPYQLHNLRMQLWEDSVVPQHQRRVELYNESMDIWAQRKEQKENTTCTG